MDNSMIKNMVRSMVLGDDDALSRIFITLDPSLNSYYEIAKPITPAGDFEIEIDVSTTSATANLTILSGILGAEDTILLRLDAGGILRAFVYVGTSATGSLLSTTPLDDGKLHTIRITLIGTSASLYIDEALEDTATWALNGSQGISLISARGGISQFFDGIIANVKITDTDASTITTFALDEATQNFELSEENVFGGDLATVNATTVPSGWSEDSIKNFSLDGTCAALSRVLYGTMLTIGITYELKLNITNHVTGDAFFNSSSFSSDKQTGDGELTIIYTATHTGINIRTTDANAEFEVEFISAREVTNAVIYNNIPESNREVFTLVGGDWIGQELVVNGGFDTDSDWTKGANWTISGGSATKSTGAESNLSQDIGSVSGEAYNIEMVVSGITGGNITIAIGQETAQHTITTNGTHEFTIVAAGVTSLLFMKGGNIFDGSIDNVSVKRILEAP